MMSRDWLSAYCWVGIASGLTLGLFVHSVPVVVALWILVLFLVGYVAYNEANGEKQ